MTVNSFVLASCRLNEVLSLRSAELCSTDVGGREETTGVDVDSGAWVVSPPTPADGVETRASKEGASPDVATVAIASAEAADAGCSMVAAIVDTETGSTSLADSGWAEDSVPTFSKTSGLISVETGAGIEPESDAGAGVG